ncbi:hypothetical protein HS125_14925 [bacterium]|nr:hypothetical protein [bacterium]
MLTPKRPKGPGAGVDFFETIVPRDLFQRIQKRDGRIVDFDKRKVTAAIWKAAQAVGGKDQALSDMLADRVIIYLSGLYDDHLLTVEEVQDAVEKVLIENGHAKTAKAFILYREERRRRREMRTSLESEAPPDAADLPLPSLSVRTSGDEIVRWDRRRITDALVRETGLPRTTADRIAIEVQKQVIHSKIQTVTAGLVRELVNAKLVELGFEEERRLHARLGVPLYDAERILTRPATAGWGKTPTGNAPAAGNAALADAITRQFALARVFPEPVNDAHLQGELHIHDLGQVTRPYSLLLTPEYVKKYGLALPAAFATAGPARRAGTLCAHLARASAALDACFAHTVAWEGWNVFLAPMIEGMKESDLADLCEGMLYEFSQQGSMQSAGPLRVDLHLYPGVPAHLADVPALGPGGEPTGKCYGEYARPARRLLSALLAAYEKGDALGRPFGSPRPLLHVSAADLEEPAARDLLKQAGRVAESKGNPTFVFDRDGDVYAGDVGRLNYAPGRTEARDIRHPWKLRCAALGLVSLNLARAAYRAEGSDELLENRISDLLTLAARAHEAKRQFLSLLLAKGDAGPLALLSQRIDGEALLRLPSAVGLVGLVGLDALCRVHWGVSLEEDLAGPGRARALLEFMRTRCRALSETYEMSLLLHHPAGGNALARLARMDLERFPRETAAVVGGIPEDGLVYYTSGLATRGRQSPWERLRLEGSGHALLEAGAVTVVHPEKPAAEVYKLLPRIYHETGAVQLAWTPEFTACRDCRALARGLSPVCRQCGSSNVEELSRMADGYGPLQPRSAAWCEAVERGALVA